MDIADEQESEMKYCSNCKRDIAVVNFVMHEVHCRKNIVLCNKCKEPVPRSEQEAHELEEHAIVNCDLCKGAFERNVLDDHKESCPKRKAQCPYCELDCIADELDNHLEYCGTRTEPCLKCQQYIMQKDLVRHEETNCLFPQPKPSNVTVQPGHAETVQRRYDQDRDVNSEGGVRLMNTFVREEYDRFRHEPRGHANEETRGGRHGKSPSSVAPPKNANQSRKTNPSQGKGTRGGSRGGINPPPRQPPAIHRKTIPDYRIREAEYLQSASSTSGMDHALALQLATGLDLNTEEVDDHFLAEKVASLQQSQSRGGTGPQEESQPMQLRNGKSTDTVMLPCENCGRSLPLSQLLDHQNQCAEPELASGGMTSPAVNQGLNNSEGGASPKGVRSQPGFIDNLNRFSGGSEGEHSTTFGDQSETWFPCEFCEECFPEDILLQHQPVCDRNPYKTPRVMTPKVNNRSVDPLHAGSSRPSYPDSQRNQPAKSNIGRGAKKIQNTSTTANQRRINSTSKTNRVLNDFRSNPSYSPLNLPGDSSRNENRHSPSSPTSPSFSDHGNSRNYPRPRGTSSGAEYMPHFTADRTVTGGPQSQSRRPRPVPRTNYNPSGLGTSGTALRTGPAQNNYTSNNRGKKYGQHKKNSNEVE